MTRTTPRLREAHAHGVSVDGMAGEKCPVCEERAIIREEGCLKCQACGIQQVRVRKCIKPRHSTSQRLWSIEGCILTAKFDEDGNSLTFLIVGKRTGVLPPSTLARIYTLRMAQFES